VREIKYAEYPCKGALYAPPLVDVAQSIRPKNELASPLEPPYRSATLRNMQIWLQADTCYGGRIICKFFASRYTAWTPMLSGAIPVTRLRLLWCGSSGNFEQVSRWSLEGSWMTPSGRVLSKEEKLVNFVDS